MKLASSRQNNKIARCDYATGKILYVYENFVHLKEANPNVKRSTLLSACNGNKNQLMVISGNMFLWIFLQENIMKLIKI